VAQPPSLAHFGQPTLPPPPARRQRPSSAPAAQLARPAPRRPNSRASQRRARLPPARARACTPRGPASALPRPSAPAAPPSPVRPRPARVVRQRSPPPARARASASRCALCVFPNWPRGIPVQQPPTTPQNQPRNLRTPPSFSLRFRRFAEPPRSSASPEAPPSQPCALAALAAQRLAGSRHRPPVPEVSPPLPLPSPVVPPCRSARSERLCALGQRSEAPAPCVWPGVPARRPDGQPARTHLGVKRPVPCARSQPALLACLSSPCPLRQRRVLHSPT
jgi:hypothetical protein